MFHLFWPFSLKCINSIGKIWFSSSGVSRFAVICRGCKTPPLEFVSARRLPQHGPGLTSYDTNRRLVFDSLLAGRSYKDLSRTAAIMNTGVLSTRCYNEQVRKWNKCDLCGWLFPSFFQFFPFSFFTITNFCVTVPTTHLFLCHC